MKNSIQIIERNGEPEWAVLPYDLYLKLAEEAETLQDIRDFDSAKAAIEKGEQELILSTITFSILDGNNPIKVWRNYRGLSQQQLAGAIGISTGYLSQLEKNKRTGTMEVLLSIAKALDITLDDIAIQPEE